jgi:hypothetical protein
MSRLMVALIKQSADEQKDDGLEKVDFIAVDDISGSRCWESKS